MVRRNISVVRGVLLLNGLGVGFMKGFVVLERWFHGEMGRSSEVVNE